MPVIEVHDLHLTRSGQPVLRGVSLEVQPGETLILMGPSGSGKSSLLRCLNRLEEPDSGRVVLHSVDIATLPVIDLRNRVGMIFQKTAPFFGTVAENIAYGPALRGQALPRERILELLDAAALERQFIDRQATELSGGQEQRLAIARALANEPEVLLLDEPTSSLDPIATRSIEDTVRHLQEQLNLTVVWVSHAIEQARRVGDRLILLEAGCITREGAVRDLLDQAAGDPHVLAFASGETQHAS